MPVTLLAAVARNGVIGVDGGLPWHLPDELALFKELTLGHVLVMGRRTFESVGRPLPGRTTVVVTRRPDWEAEGVLRAESVGEALALAREVDADPEGDTRFPEIDWSQWREVGRRDGQGWTHVTFERGVASAA